MRVPAGAAASRDPGWAGNLMVMRLVGASLHLVAAHEYDASGGWVCAQALQVRVVA